MKRARPGEVVSLASSEVGERWPAGTGWSTISSTIWRQRGGLHFRRRRGQYRGLYDAAYFREDITAVLAKHEFSAATMADGYSRASSALGVVAATSGGGSLNLVAGLGESFTSRVPVLALVGQAPTTLDGRGSFQDTSGRNGSLCAEALFSEISVYCRRVLTPADILEGVAGGGGGRPHGRSRGAAAAEKRSAGQPRHQRRRRR